MVVKEAVAGADDGFAIALWIPSESDSRRNIVVVAGDALDDAELLCGGGVNGGGGSKERADFEVVANAVVQGELAGGAPGVLGKDPEGKIVKGSVGRADALNIGLRDADAIGLRAGDSGQTAAEEGNAAKVAATAEIELEDLLLLGTQLNEIGIRTELESVTTAGDGDVVGELEAALDAIDRRVRFAAKVAEARDVHGDVGAARKIGEADMNTAPGVLKAKFVEGGVTEDGVVLKSDIEVAGLVQANARTGVLAENLVLRGGLDAGDKRGRNADANERGISIVPALIEASGPEAGFFIDGEIAAQGIEADVRRRQRHQAHAGSWTLHVAGDGVWRAVHRARKELRIGKLACDRRTVEESGHGDLGAVDVDVEIALYGDVGRGTGSDRSPKQWLNSRVRTVCGITTDGGTNGCIVGGQLGSSHAEGDGSEGRGIGDAGDVSGGEAEIALADAGEAGFFALGVFVGEEEKGFVFLEGAAESGGGLNGRLGLVGGNPIGGRVDLTGERVARLERFIAEVTKDVPVEIVGATLGNDFDDTTCGTAIFRVVIAEDHLEFLDGLLRNGGADAVDGVVHGVGAVNADHIGASARAADARAAVGGGGDGGRVIAQSLGIDQSEIDVVAAVDGKIFDLALLD